MSSSPSVKENAFLRSSTSNLSIGEVLEAVIICGAKWFHIAHSGISRGWVQQSKITTYPAKILEIIPKEFYISNNRPVLLWEVNEIDDWLKEQGKPRVKEIVGSDRLRTINLMTLRALILCAFSRDPKINFPEVYSEGFQTWKGVPVRDLNKLNPQAVHRRHYELADAKFYVGLSDESFQLSRSMSNESDRGRREEKPGRSQHSLLKIAHINLARQEQRRREQQHSPNSSESDSSYVPGKKVSFSQSLNETLTLHQIDNEMKTSNRKTSSSFENDEKKVAPSPILRKPVHNNSNVVSPPESNNSLLSLLSPPAKYNQPYQYDATERNTRQNSVSPLRTKDVDDAPFQADNYNSPPRRHQEYTSSPPSLSYTTPSGPTQATSPENHQYRSSAREHQFSPQRGSSSDRAKPYSKQERSPPYTTPHHERSPAFSSSSQGSRYKGTQKYKPRRNQQSPHTYHSPSSYRSLNKADYARQSPAKSFQSASSRFTDTPYVDTPPVPRHSKPKKRKYTEDSADTHLSEWLPEDVFQFLVERIPALRRYRRNWMALAIDGNFVLYLNSRDLEEIGIRNKTLQKRILFLVKTELKGLDANRAMKFVDEDCDQQTCKCSIQ